MAHKRAVELTRDLQANASYVYLPDHPGEAALGCVANTIPLDQLIGEYQGCDIHLDFDRDGRLIGIEIMSA